MDVDYIAENVENNKNFDSINKGSTSLYTPTAIEHDGQNEGGVSAVGPDHTDGADGAQHRQKCDEHEGDQSLQPPQDHHNHFESVVDVLQISIQESRSHSLSEYDDNKDNVDLQYHREEGRVRARGSNTSTITAAPTKAGVGFDYTSSTTSAASNNDNDNVDVDANLNGKVQDDVTESPDRALGQSTAGSHHTGQFRRNEQQRQGNLGHQRRLSIQDLLVNHPSPLSTSFSHIHNRSLNGSRNGSPNSIKSTPSPLWPQVPTPASAVPIGRTSSPHISPRPYHNETGVYHQQSPGYGHHPQSHSPVPFPSPRRDRPDPITLRSFPSSSLRTSSRLASPYARPSGSQGQTPGLRVDMSVHSATSPVIAAAMGTMDSPGPETSQNGHESGAGLGILSPNGSGSGSGSMSTQGRRKAPEWPSAKKKDSRSYSFNTLSSAQTPREWYVKTPTALRVPPTAGVQQSPAFPSMAMRHHYDTPGAGVGGGRQSPSTPGFSKRAGDVPGSASASAPARRVHLTDVPKTLVIKALHNKASEYWYSPETSDCRIYVPIPRKKSSGLTSATISDMDPDMIMADEAPLSDWPPTPASGSEEDGGRANVVKSHGRTSGMGRRGSGGMPSDQDVPVLVFPLHRDYLMIQSNLLRILFQSTSIQMAFRTSPTRPSFIPPTSNSLNTSNAGGVGRAISPGPATPQARSFPARSCATVSASASGSGSATTPGPGPGSKALGAGMSIKGARIIPSREEEPVSIFLPVPDPASFGVVLHWLYWGDVGSLESVLSRSMVTWQGIVKNIEYLSLDDSIKRVMGKWWRTWVKTDVGRQSQSQSQTQSQQHPESRSGPGRRGGRAGSSDIDSGSDNEREEDGMQVDDQDQLDRGVPLGGVEKDDGGVSQLLKNL